jgi:hypothetical protein
MECKYKSPSCGEYYRYLSERTFQSFLKRELKIKKIPYKLTVEELHLNKVIEPSLLLKFPQVDGEKSVHECRDIPRYRKEDFNIECLLHPYDGKDEKCKEFIQRFKAKIPETFEVRRHSNGTTSSEYKAYFNYSVGYIFIEALGDGYEYIGNFLSQDKGKQKLFQNFSETYERWKKNSLLSIFDRLSYYITAMSIYLWHKRVFYQNEAPPFSFRDAALFIAEETGYSHEDMEEDMVKLVDPQRSNFCPLFQQWKRNSEKNCLYKPAVELLRWDIYYLLQWMCYLSGNTPEYYFENKWPKHETMRGKWNPKVSYLNDALEYEDFDLKDIFLQHIPLYIENIPERIVPKEEGERYKYLFEIYKRLTQYDEFKPWNRAFKELHKSLAINGRIDFNQTRIIDYLLIITIRTEVFVRAACKENFKIDERDLKKIFCKLASKFNECKKENSLFCVVFEEFNNLTTLYDTPEKMFDKIEKYQKKKNWNDEILLCFKPIMKFITARNYFAHHCYKDDEINRRDETAEKILSSCVETVLIIDKAMQGECFL